MTSPLENIPLTAVLSIADHVLSIIARHRDSGNTAPLTNEQVHAELTSDLQNGESAIAKEFRAKGWELPK